jgi:hypothetical protein
VSPANATNLVLFYDSGASPVLEYARGWSILRSLSVICRVTVPRLIFCGSSHELGDLEPVFEVVLSQNIWLLLDESQTPGIVGGIDPIILDSFFKACYLICSTYRPCAFVFSGLASMVGLY